MGSDWVICASPKLKDTLARLEDAYAATHAARGKLVAAEQVAWITRYGTVTLTGLEGARR